MKAVTLLLLGLFANSVLAESPFERELTQLATQRDQQISAATEPINRRYKDSLEMLLRRATQANDLDAAVKIRQALGITSAASPAAPATVELSKRGLETRLEGKTFVTESNSWLHKMTFEKGIIIHNPNDKGQGRAASFHAVGGTTVAFEWDGKRASMSFSADLSSCERGKVKYTKQ